MVEKCLENFIDFMSIGVVNNEYKKLGIINVVVTIEGRWTSNVCMAAYYPALCLLAGSMVVYMYKGEKK